MRRQTVIRPRSLTEELREVQVRIPRCPTCRRAHEDPRPTPAAHVLTLLCGASGAGLALLTRWVEWSIPMAEPAWTVALSGASLGVGLGGILWGFRAQARVQKACRDAGARSLEDGSDHPDIKRAVLGGRSSPLVKMAALHD